MIEHTEGLEAGESAHLFALYLFDETQINEYIRKYDEETMVTGLFTWIITTKLWKAWRKSGAPC